MSSPFLSKRYINVFTALLIVLVFYFLYSETQPAASPPSSHFTRPEVAVPANFGPPEPVKNIGEQALDHTLALEQKIFCRVLPEFTSASYSTRDVLLHGRTFKMAYFTKNDIVSSSIRNSGTWEGPLVESILEKLALVSKIRGEDKATFIDIGANIGWFSMAIGSQGYKVIAFEPMPQTEALFRSSLCFNPEINARVRYHALGLGKTTEFCDLWSDNYNLGDGHVSCGNAPIKGVTDSNSYSRRATINVQKLDDVMGTTHLDDIAVIKLDVEGFEPNVFNGALTWLKRAQPPFIVSELAPPMMAQKGLSPLEFLQTIDGLGYDIRKDSWEGTLITPSQFSTHIGKVGNEEVYMTSRKWKTA